ncbi:hypothetical protein DPMN_129450 [Dreissena polymorpha]|uniref:Uncharacterized protein n=1 Tax=Dreissena polymorpha TaxID=45954 RepID=A0A9D4H172_DREPO|nr:hypothetical protein DPMN_129450 [Dreissena polymorpha]
MRRQTVGHDEVIRCKCSEDQFTCVSKTASCSTVLHDSESCRRTQKLVKSEIESTLHFYFNKHSGLLNKVLNTVSGGMAVIIKEGLSVEIKFTSLLKAFQ